jgi:DNA invertase Pin-like site-specific DNA recombinase
MAEFERGVIRERVKAVMKNARAWGTRIGRPRANVDASQIARLGASGASLRDIAARLGVSVGTVAASSKKAASHRGRNRLILWSPDYPYGRAKRR